MKIKIVDLWVCQSDIKRAFQINDLIDSIENDRIIPVIKISEMDNGEFRIEDGVHRSLAYLKSGRTFLFYGEFEIVPFNKSRNTIGKLIKYRL